MTRFYSTDFEGGVEHTSGIVKPSLCVLPEQESLHCTKVLRLKTGDLIEVTDGKGNLYKACLQDINYKSCIAQIVDIIAIPDENQRPNIDIVLSPTKQLDRIEWFVEKATEMGLGSISFIYTHRTERTKVTLERIDKILVSAMKQSLQRYKPILNTLISWKDFVEEESKIGGKKLKYIAYCGDEYSKLEYSKELCKNKDDIKQRGVKILIGPEGDFTPQEVEQAVKTGYIPVLLGPNRLRTETAALYAVCAAQTTMLCAE